MEQTSTEPVVTLEGPSMEPYLSDYLMRGGIQKDVSEIQRVVVAGRRIEATCRMRTWFVSPHDGQFHLSGVVGSTLLVQVGIIHGLMLEGARQKTGEVYLSDYQMKLIRAITATEGLLVRMELTHRLVLPNVGQAAGHRTFCSWRFDVSEPAASSDAERAPEGAWRGRMTLVFPIDN